MTSRSIALCISAVFINISWCILGSSQPYQLISFEQKKIIESIIEKNTHFQCVISEVRNLCDDENLQRMKPSFFDYACTRELIRMTAKKFDCSEPHIAIFLGTPEAIQYGKKYIVEHPHEYQDLRRLLIDAAQLHRDQLAWKGQDLGIAESLFAMGVSVEKDEDLCVDAILYAMHNGKTKFVTLLLEKGVDVNTRLSDGGTFAMLAGYLGNEKILRLLVRHKADLMATDDFGKNISSYACENGKVAIVKMLTAWGVIVPYTSPYPWYPEEDNGIFCDPAQKVASTESKICNYSTDT